MTNPFSLDGLVPVYSNVGNAPIYQQDHDFMDEFENHRAHIAEDPDAFVRDMRTILAALA